MERTEIIEKVTEVAVDVLGIEPEEVAEANSFDDLEADSLERLQLVTAIEDAFDIEIPDDKLESLNSMDDVVDVIESVTEA